MKDFSLYSFLNIKPDFEKNERCNQMDSPMV